MQGSAVDIKNDGSLFNEAVRT